MVIRRPEPKKYYKRSDIIDHSVKVWIDGRLVARLEPVYTSESLAPAWRFKPEVSWLSPKEFNDLGELFEELIQKAEEAFRVVAYWPVFLDKKGWVLEPKFIEHGRVKEPFAIESMAEEWQQKAHQDDYRDVVLYKVIKSTRVSPGADYLPKITK